MLSDLDIGMNDWVVPRLTWDDAYRPDRGRVLDAGAARAASRNSSATTPEDENHVAARTLPGVHSKGAFFTRGSGHNKFGGYTETPDEYQEVVDRLLQQAQSRREIRARAGHRAQNETRRIGVVTIGGCDRPCAKRWTCSPRSGIHGRLHAHPRIPVRRERRGIS